MGRLRNGLSFSWVSGRDWLPFRKSTMGLSLWGEFLEMGTQVHEGEGHESVLCNENWRLPPVLGWRTERRGLVLVELP